MSSSCSVILACAVLICVASLAASPTVDGLRLRARSAQDKEARVTLGVFYESRCPDSKRFFLKQLVPAYKDIGNITKLQLVPFGHARVLSKDKMICQHGARECEGNRLMACVQAHGSQHQAQVVDTLGCLFENKLAPKSCVEKHLPTVSYDDIERCKSSDESAALMLEFEKLTGQPDYVPKLTIDGQHSEEIQDEAEHRLKAYVCRLYKGADKPLACQKPTES